MEPDEQTTNEQRSTWIAVAAVAAASILFSCKGLFLKGALQSGTPALDVQAVRMAAVLPFYAAVLLLARRSEPGEGATLRDHLLAMLVGLLGCYVAPIANIHGLERVSAGLERILLCASPATVILAALVLQGARPSRRALLAAFVGICGALLAAAGRDQGQAHANLLGVALVVLGMLAWSVFLIATRPLSRRLGTARFTALSSFAGATACVLHWQGASLAGVSAASPDPLSAPGSVLLLCAGAAVLGTVIPSFLLARGIESLGAGRASTISMVGPVVTPVLTVLALGETMSALQLAGLAVVLVAVRLQEGGA